MHRQRPIMGGYPTPPPARARRPPRFISTGLVIKLERVACLDALRRALGRSARHGPCRKSVHVPRRAPLIPQRQSGAANVEALPNGTRVRASLAEPMLASFDGAGETSIQYRDVCQQLRNWR